MRTTTPTPAQTTITVLNGNGIEGAAANAGYLLSQRGYQIVPPPDGATGNAPRTNYFSSKVYWNPRVKRSEAAAKSVAKLFAPADAERCRPRCAPLGRNAMITVVVGSTFHGTITPAPPVKHVPTHARAGARHLEPVRHADAAQGSCRRRCRGSSSSTRP